ncbi:two-component sensor histidine kinase [Planomonospora sp. ID91781]|uniref:sensor histidine kinase n=1 Tax=Planomonospora sp. ID91781 TaxID=2738135 RepID=UPI0018C3CB6E|nr:histidine kinase [Planomonospora sp. ID91781]MBG0821047.1 two-component sensor histidine kinase [Planomonospora sp. ID91781]
MSGTWAGDRLRRLREVWRVYDATVWDRWLAVVSTGLAFVPALSIMSVQFGDLSGRPADAFQIVLILAQTVPLAVRTRWPAACLAINGTAFAIHETLGYPMQFGTVTVYIALYSAGAHQERFRRVIAAAASAAYVVLCAAAVLLGSPVLQSEFLVFYLLFAACWLGGAFVRGQRLQEAGRRRLAAEAAAAAERARIARELHDVVTHHVTAIVVQADATQFVATSPERVATALSTIGGAGRRALAELRYLLDVLEATGESATPVVGNVRDLVERARSGGQPIELVEDGDRPPLPVGVGLAVYRVVQEGLTNAVKYAEGRPTTVRIGCRDDRVEVEVTNAPAAVPVGARSGLSGGRGLAGLRDRIGALGGALAAGEQPDGGFRVSASIPVGGAE